MAKAHLRNTQPYENNPFNIGLNGFKLFFENAQSVAIYAIVLCAVVFLFNTASNVMDVIDGRSGMSRSQQNQADTQAIRDTMSQDTGHLVVGGIVVASVIFLVILVMLVLNGVLEYAGARMALGEKVGLKQAFREVLKELPGYLWVNIIMLVKLFLWTLLLVVPGIIMAVRYRLSGTVFFAEGKRGNAAVKRSAELTKGAWFTTFAGYGLWNLITFNQIQQLVAPGVSAILYRQLRTLTDAGESKPSAHWLSWLTLLVPIALILLFLGFFLFVVALAYSFGR